MQLSVIRGDHGRAGFSASSSDGLKNLAPPCHLAHTVRQTLIGPLPHPPGRAEAGGPRHGPNSHETSSRLFAHPLV